MHRTKKLRYPELFAATAIAVASSVGCGSQTTGPAPSASASTATIASSTPAGNQAVGQSACSANRPSAFARANGSRESASIELLKATGAAHVSLVLVADADEHAVHTIDAQSMEEIAVTPIEGVPRDLLVLADGRVAMTLRDRARVAIFEPASQPDAPLEKRCEVEVAAEPWSLAEHGDSLYVTSAFGASLSTFRASDMALLKEIALPREPRSIVIDPNGKTAFVSHATGGVVSAIDLENPNNQPIRIDLRTGRRTKNSDGEAGTEPREATQAYAMAILPSPPSEPSETWRLLVPHTTVDPGIVGEGISGGGYGGSVIVKPVAPIVGVIDPVARRLITQSAGLSRTGNMDCILPRSALVAGDKLYVACLDNAVVELDPWLSDPMMGELRRFGVPAGPSGLAVSTDDSPMLFVWSELDRGLSRVDINDKKSQDPSIVSMVPWQRADQKTDPLLARGRRLFHTTRDMRLSQGRACESCHPEGRDDGLVWSSPDGARQTPMLAGRLAGTAPYGWFGENATLRDHLDKTFERLGGTGLEGPNDKSDLEALIAYISALPPFPEPGAPGDRALVGRGKDVFVAAGCAGCHKDGATDNKTHDVGSGVKNERKGLFDTPSLKGVRESAPYFHDGRYAKLDDVIGDSTSRMFDSASISLSDKKALLAYLETL